MLFVLLIAALVLSALSGCTPSATAAPQPETLPSLNEVAASAAPVVVNAKASASGLPSRLVVPAIGVDASVVELGWTVKTNGDGQSFSEWEDPADAAGWHKNSALPGKGNNTVLSGHNNIAGAVFRELDLLKRGDVATVYVGDTPHDYIVDEVMIVPEKFASTEQRKENVEWIQATGDERLTLVSCWPRDDNTHRIIVVAHPADAN
jgi:sortase A